MRISDEELAQKLARIPDQEIKTYDEKRRKKVRILFAIALVCGIAAVVMFFTHMQTLALVVGIVGIVAVQWGAYSRARWKQTYEYLMYQRHHQLSKEKTASETKDIHGQKFRSKKQ